jgi:tRNA(fMet)-specific endonuclease VapC
MPYLLDTNVWVAHLRGRSRPVRDRLAAVPVNEVFFSSIVKAELLYGAYHSADPAHNLALLAQLFNRFNSIAFTDSAADVYGQIRHATARTGQSVGGNDLLIAATALASGLTLVTRNVNEFSRIPNLVIEDWERDASP